MEGRESGMPDGGYWESFFNPRCILERLGCQGSVGDVVEFGCGYGTFTVPAARATLDRLQAKLGRVPNMYRTLAHAPQVLDAAVAMAKAVRSDLDPKVRELVYLKVVQLTDCHV